jgi:hypothetical protein
MARIGGGFTKFNFIDDGFNRHIILGFIATGAMTMRPRFMCPR